MSKVSISTWVKKNNGMGDIYGHIVQAVRQFAAEGSHPDIQWDGEDPLLFANVLYLEQAHRAKGVCGGLYCTRPEVAKRMAESLKLRHSETVLNPGCGLLSLTRAVAEVAPSAWVVNVEHQDWLIQISQVTDYLVTPGDFLEGLDLPPFDAVIVNPPWGKMGGYSSIEQTFMARIASLTRPGTKIAALLPGGPGYFFDRLPKKFERLKSELAVRQTEYLERHTATLPHNITECTRYLLERV